MEFALAEGCRIYVCGKTAELADLEPGWEVTVFVDHAGKAAAIRAKAEESEVTGTVVVVSAASITVAVAHGEGVSEVT